MCGGGSDSGEENPVKSFCLWLCVPQRCIVDQGEITVCYPEETPQSSAQRQPQVPSASQHFRQMAPAAPPRPNHYTYQHLQQQQARTGQAVPGAGVSVQFAPQTPNNAPSPRSIPAPNRVPALHVEAVTSVEGATSPMGSGRPLSSMRLPYPGQGQQPLPGSQQSTQRGNREKEPGHLDALSNRLLSQRSPRSAMNKEG
uniref:Uncharacterized protein n=1 Tax=Chromera velia CCMP2878 TaxID=1169474 RepID=A0A0G4HXH0_9ALVE|mmetsp:Transcript_12086/g.23322  ORF Transcript_12086/g.23322 Transcript_12086/m.23322 type:complete len:199 (-) Transcript_12086:298-894(-)|eukprot:Cvel_1490.t1-p1 / transcript=Cvel_1490.t1 / gene=Cvel_1490 / organism=Chromera_velia_CCMP2878 / gene_product=hypothetical protein / transcript_product=hypothetical protein / location=Cvel_scaffold52:69999-70592(+) / protein_length=198 / sequence_SO=supercontig / SO=protein_coding / is_pseudo=false